MKARIGGVVLGAAIALATLAVPAAAPAPAQPPVTRYVALGDSFTAGPLIPTQLGDPIGGFRSDHDYPHLVAASLHVPSFADASCSGAKTDDINNPQDVNPGPDNPPQLDRLDAQTQLVTIGIGGNDIGYSEIIQTCATSGRSGTPCQDHYVHGGDDEISDRIADTAPKVADVLGEIHSRAPDAEVFLVNYLSVLPETGSGCFPQVPFADADVPYLRAKEHELNDMLAKQAAGANAVLVDAFAASLGHDACQAPGVRWVEPLATASPAVPGHPNGLGMECTAVVVLAAVAPAAPADPTLCAPPMAPVGAPPMAAVAVPAFTG